MRKKINIFVYFLVTLVFLEMLLKILLKAPIFSFATISMLIFLVIFAFLLYFICSLFSEKGNKIVFYIIMSLLSIWAGAQYVIKDVFGFFIDIALLTGAGSQVAEGGFIGETINQILVRIPWIAVILIPLILSIVFCRKINFRCRSKKKLPIIILAMVLFSGVYYGSLFIGKKKTYSAYRLTKSIWNTDLTVEKLGIFNTLFLDNYKTITNFQEEIIIDDPNEEEEDDPKEKEYEYNNLNIDFDTLIAETGDSNIKTMGEYFKSDSGTLQNEYTGLFEGKNLIMFMAESFNEIAVSEELTPTLYKLIHNGFEFTNYYSPTIFSTIGGEMQELTGLYPAAYGTFKTGSTYYPMGLGTIFREKGYSTYAYHDHSYTFQSRNLYLKAMGFDNFKGCGNGLEKLINCNAWPESDVEMIEKTYDEYAKSTGPFMVFYASVSGHGSWTWANASSKKYISYFENQGRPYPESIQAYIASQMELDRALELLLKKLSDQGILDDTVIVLTGDHYPYMLTESGNTEEISYFTNTLGKDLVIDINHSNLIIYNSAMDKVSVDKVGSQIDVIPTVYNLFGLNYDSRLFIGRDILATNEGLAMFGNRSWVSDKGKYFASSGKFVPNDETEEIDEEYVARTTQIVNNKINMSRYIIERNFYKTAWNYVTLPEVKKVKQIDYTPKETQIATDETTDTKKDESKEKSSE